MSFGQRQDSRGAGQKTRGLWERDSEQSLFASIVEHAQLCCYIPDIWKRMSNVEYTEYRITCYKCQAQFIKSTFLLETGKVFEVFFNFTEKKKFIRCWVVCCICFQGSELNLCLCFPRADFFIFYPLKHSSYIHSYTHAYILTKPLFHLEF